MNAVLRIVLAVVASLVVGAGVGAGAGAIVAAVRPSAIAAGWQTVALDGDTPGGGSPVEASSDPSDTWLVDFTRIGPVRMDMTRDQAEALHPGLKGDDFEGYCANYYWGDGTSPWGLMSVLLASQGSYGPIDSIDIVGPADAGLPRTAAGIGLGSTESEVLAAYPSAEVSAHTYLEYGHYVDVYGPDRTTAIRFDTDRGVVVRVAVGRVPQVLYVEGCL
jgi:hypothetical protein